MGPGPIVTFSNRSRFSELDLFSPPIGTRHFPGSHASFRNRHAHRAHPTPLTRLSGGLETPSHGPLRDSAGPPCPSRCTWDPEAWDVVWRCKRHFSFSTPRAPEISFCIRDQVACGCASLHGKLMMSLDYFASRLLLLLFLHNLFLLPLFQPLGYHARAH